MKPLGGSESDLCSTSAATAWRTDANASRQSALARVSMTHTRRIHSLRLVSVTMLCVVAGALAWGNFSVSGGGAGGDGSSGTWTQMSLYEYGWPFNGLVRFQCTTGYMFSPKQPVTTVTSEYHRAEFVCNILVALVIVVGTASVQNRWLLHRRIAVALVSRSLRLAIVTAVVVCAVVLGTHGIFWLGDQFHLSRGNSLPMCLMMPIVYGIACALIAAMSHLVPLPRFRLRTLFLGTAVVGTILGWLAWERHTLIERWCREQPAIAAIQAAGGRSYNSLRHSHFPDWFVDPKYRMRVTRVDLRSMGNADTVVRELRPLRRREGLGLKVSDITDVGLTQIAELDPLTGLELERTHVTDKGVTSLRRLPRLRDLNLYETKATSPAWLPK